MVGSSQAFLEEQTSTIRAVLGHAENRRARQRFHECRSTQRTVSRRASAPLGGLALALVLALPGCGKFREISACRGVAREVNAALDEIEPLSKAKLVDELRIAERYTALAQALGPRATGATPLAEAVRDYIAIVQDTCAALRALGDASKAPDGKTHEARRDLDRLVKRERIAASRIEGECQR